jgi:hypothetical protein
MLMEYTGCLCGGEGGRGDRWKWQRENEKERVRVEKRIIGWDKTG